MVDLTASKRKFYMRIAAAGIGYVEMFIAVLLAQHNQVTAVDILLQKVVLINQKKSPIQDDEIEHFFAEKPLNLVATTDGNIAYSEVDFVVISTPTDYDQKKKVGKRLLVSRS